ncbi:MAG: hypothetical protein IRZ09_13665 [Variibacter sp.]|nr:hypothetical protein [Variibacter sp.]
MRLRSPYGPQIDLPPPYRLVTLREIGDAFAHAVRIAPEDGAGTLVLAGRFDLVEFALVLEPDEALRTARRTVYAGMAALADALAVHAPPNKLIQFDWPDVVLVDGALVGGGRLAWPADAAEDAAPAWLVFGATVRTAVMEPIEPGLHPTSSALEDEGFEDLGTGQLVASFARHFLTLLDAWQERGFSAVAKAYLERLPLEFGLRGAIAENGDLMLRRAGEADGERRSLLPRLTEVAWLDRETGGPKL